MALFKILQGVAKNLPSKKTEGYCYVTTDEGKFYVDITGTKRICLNAELADKLKTARSIAIAGGAVANVQYGATFDGSKDITIPLGAIYSSYLAWGGRVISGDISPLDAALSYDHSANRLQFAKPAGITVEYSTDGGTTWLDYGLTDTQKINFVSGINQPLYYGKHSNGVDRTVNDQLRITINANACEVYTNLKTVLIYGSTGGQIGTQVKIESAKRGSETKFTQVTGPYHWDGWSGWNSFPINIGAFGGGSSQTNNTGALRFTFTFTGLNTNYTQTPNIINMMMFGTTHWIAPSNMSAHGHIYNWDASQNVYFPAGITAKAVTVTQAAGFTYSGIESASANADRVIWFSDSNAIGRPVYNNNFKYNPSTGTLTVKSISGFATKVANALKINNKTFDGSAAIDVGTIGIGYGGTGATTAANALINLNGNTAKGSATVPIYWTGSAWATITSYSGKASTAGTADKVANALSINGKTYNGSAAIDVGVIGAAYGGSGKTTLEDSANTYLDALPIWVANPTDDTYLIRQDTTGALSYGKVKFNTVYNYIKGKTDTLYSAIGHTHNYLPLSGGTVTGNFQVSNNNSTAGYVKIWEDNEGGNIAIASPNGKAFQIDAYNDTTLRCYAYDDSNNLHAFTFNRTNGAFSAESVYGAVWNDYAEFRVAAEQVISGQVVYSDNRGELHKTTERLQAFEGVVSDTFGFAIGETEKAKTPLAVAGRVLAYPDEDRYTFHAGDVVCAGKFGTISKMTREEIIAYPDRIVGIVSEIPEYETWGSGNVPVYNRIWIRVK